jgi:1-acyl-sn-glycerol-3-phosphate acyltransferase
VTNEQAHQLAREKGVSRVLYALVRGIVVPFMRLWFRMRIDGAELIPREGAAIVVPNHKSFWDSFFVAAATRRHLRYMGKSELFEGPWGRLLIRLGAFPVRRGQADEAALETAREILRQDGLLAMFPEGTRVRDPEELGSPRKGAGRLALETGAPLVPAAITGTDHLFLGPIPKPKRVQLAFSAPIPAADLPPTPEAAGELVEERVWPEVEREFRGLLSRPGVIAAGLALLGASLGGGVAYRRRQAARKRSRNPFRRR